MTNEIDILKARVYTEYRDRIYGYIRSKISNPHDAEELLSVVFLKVYENLDRFDPMKASLTTWVYTIARNCITDFFRTRRVHEELPENLTVQEDCFEGVYTDESLEELADALIKLSEKERDVVILHYYKGYTLKKVAEIMCISYSYAKVLHGKALILLETLLK